MGTAGSFFQLDWVTFKTTRRGGIIFGRSSASLKNVTEKGTRGKKGGCASENSQLRFCRKMMKDGGRVNHTQTKEHNY